MKNITKIIASKLLFLIFYSSCTKTDITVDSSQIIFSADITSASTSSPTALQLSKDPDFIALNSLNLHILRYAPAANLNTMDKGYLTPAELQQVALNLQFVDSTSFLNTLNAQSVFSLNLRIKYPNLTDAAIAGACNILNPKLPQPCSTCFVTPCYDQFILCSKTANNDYTIGIIKCTVEAIGLGLVFGVGGVVYQLGCGALEIRKLNLARQQCSLNYRSCS